MYSCRCTCDKRVAVKIHRTRLLCWLGQTAGLRFRHVASQPARPRSRTHRRRQAEAAELGVDQDPLRAVRQRPVAPRRGRVGGVRDLCSAAPHGKALSYLRQKGSGNTRQRRRLRPHAGGRAVRRVLCGPRYSRPEREPRQRRYVWLRRMSQVRMVLDYYMCVPRWGTSGWTRCRRRRPGASRTQRRRAGRRRRRPAAPCRAPRRCTPRRRSGSLTDSQTADREEKHCLRHNPGGSTAGRQCLTTHTRRARLRCRSRTRPPTGGRPPALPSGQVRALLIATVLCESSGTARKGRETQGKAVIAAFNATCPRFCGGSEGDSAIRPTDRQAGRQAQ
eukprot:SAG22_NODE_73_length_22318_cov_47.105315_4_plen_334_part_00